MDLIKLFLNAKHLYNRPLPSVLLLWSVGPDFKALRAF